MNHIVHKAQERGQADHGWLQTSYSFSFGDWYDPTRMGFGALRVINDDTIAPQSGFRSHSHRDMEIITIVMEGTVTHKDSMGNIGHVPAGDIQVMSAGTGVTHSEYNDSETLPLKLFQIWITPRQRGISPRYSQKTFTFSSSKEGSMELVSPEGNDLNIMQDAYITYAVVTSQSSYSYEMRDEGNGVYTMVIEGSVCVESEKLHTRDAIGITESRSIIYTTQSQAKLLIIEVPMH